MESVHLICKKYTEQIEGISIMQQSKKSSSKKSPAVPVSTCPRFPIKGKQPIPVDPGTTARGDDAICYARRDSEEGRRDGMEAIDCDRARMGLHVAMKALGDALASSLRIDRPRDGKAT